MRSRLTAPVLVASALALGVGIGVAVRLPAPRPATSPPADDDRVAALDAELRGLRGQLGALAVNVASHGAAPPAAASVVPAVEKPAVRATPEEERAHREAEAAFLNASLDAQPRDAAWAPATEVAVASFYAAPEHRDAHFVNATCRATLCRLELAFDDEAARADHAARLSLELPQFGAATFTYPDGPRPTLVAFVARAGHPMPDGSNRPTLAEEMPR